MGILKSQTFGPIGPKPAQLRPPQRRGELSPRPSLPASLFDLTVDVLPSSTCP